MNKYELRRASDKNISLYEHLVDFWWDLEEWIKEQRTIEYEIEQ